MLETASCLTIYFFSILLISEEVAFLHYHSCVVVPIKINRGMFKMSKQVSYITMQALQNKQSRYPLRFITFYVRKRNLICVD